MPSCVRSLKKRRRRASSSRKRLSTTIIPTSSCAQEVVEALGEEHQRRPVRIVEEVREELTAELLVEQDDVAGERSAGERLEDGVGDGGRHLAPPDAVPLHLAVERPPVRAQRLPPQLAERPPVLGAKGDAAEREHAALVEPSALVDERAGARSRV